ncbi:hypothetical protein [Desulfospira joergensenii]|uniref:hypothetical protein n=1 Tax=Desulfospira joergensenii TaxID=53329 RepID=UPI0003B702D7|nr:hypothetical protein [Desulfospira joergensenii]
MLIKLLKILPPSISYLTFYIIISIVIIFRFLLSSVYGGLTISICLYYYFELFSSSPPLSALELLDWAISLPSEYKTAILTSVITVTGFAVAFHTATINWRNQMKAQLKNQAANEVENFFAFIAQNINTTTIYIESLIKIVNEIQKGSSTIESIDFSICYAQGKAQEFLDARKALSQASIDVHRLIGKNYSLLTLNFSALPLLQNAASSLSNITNKMWVHVPIVDLNSNTYIQSFLNQANISEYQDFLDACNNNDIKMFGLSGGAQGALNSPIIGFSFPQVIHLLSKRKDFKKIIMGLHEQLNDDIYKTKS